MIFHLSHLKECRLMKVSINEFMGWEGKLTHRQMQMWNTYRHEELNQPSRSDHYLMQIAAYSSGKKNASLDDFRIPFVQQRESTPEEKAKEADWYKQIWIARVGGMKALTIKDQAGNVIKKPEVPIRSNNRTLPVAKHRQLAGRQEQNDKPPLTLLQRNQLRRKK